MRHSCDTIAQRRDGQRFPDRTEPALEARIRVRLTPRSGRNEIVGWQNSLLRVRVTAPPVDGKANAALERLIAKAVGVPKRDVSVISGARGREKTVEIAGMSRDDAEKLLGQEAT